MAADAPSFLAERLNAAGPLPAGPANTSEPLEPGRIYVAVPDRHLMIEGDMIRLTHGPRESHARPSIDVLFRSAAYYAGPRVIGIVLTGMLDDGTAGLWAIKDRGGIAIVQSPDQAPYPAMPRNALRHVKADYILQIEDIPNVLRSLTREHIEIKERNLNNRLEVETRIALEENALQKRVRALGAPSFYTCPECHGSMVVIEEGSIKRFRCHTGHAYSGTALLAQTLPNIEATLWSALAQAEERQILLNELAQRAASQSEDANGYAEQARRVRVLAEKIRTLTADPTLQKPQSQDQNALDG